MPTTSPAPTRPTSGPRRIRAVRSADTTGRRLIELPDDADIESVEGAQFWFLHGVAQLAMLQAALALHSDPDLSKEASLFVAYGIAERTREFDHAVLAHRQLGGKRADELEALRREVGA